MQTRMRRQTLRRFSAVARVRPVSEVQSSVGPLAARLESVVVVWSRSARRA